MPRDNKRKGWLALAWLSFALLLFASGGFLLFACGINILFGYRYCPVAIDTSSLDREIATREALLQGIHAAEIDVARLAPCADPPPQRRAAVPDKP